MTRTVKQPNHLTTPFDSLLIRWPTMNLLLIGESPDCHDTDDLGLVLWDLLAIDVRNLLDSNTGRAGKGTQFPLTEARAAAKAMIITGGLTNRDVIFLGHRVVSAFPLKCLRVDRYGVRYDRILDGLDFLRWFRYDDPQYGQFHFAVVPHPVSDKYWWNDADNGARARQFLRDAIWCRGR